MGVNDAPMDNATRVVSCLVNGAPSSLRPHRGIPQVRAGVNRGQAGSARRGREASTTRVASGAGDCVLALNPRDTVQPSRAKSFPFPSLCFRPRHILHPSRGT